MTVLLDVKRLIVSVVTRTGLVHALYGVSFEMGVKRLGIVGESGSRKSTVGRTIMGLRPHTARVTGERFQFDNTDLLTSNEATFRALRGRRIGLVMQDPLYALNHVFAVGP